MSHKERKGKVFDPTDAASGDLHHKTFKGRDVHDVTHAGVEERAPRAHENVLDYHTMKRASAPHVHPWDLENPEFEPNSVLSPGVHESHRRGA